MDDPANPGNTKLTIGIMFLAAWHIISLPFMVWAMVTGPGGNMCGPSDQLMIMFLGGSTDALLLLVSAGTAVAKRKLLHIPLLINLLAVVIILLSGVLKP